MRWRRSRRVAWRALILACRRRPRCAQYTRGDKRSGVSKAVHPQRDGFDLNKWKLIFNETFRIPATLYKEDLGHGKHQYQKKCVVFALCKMGADKAGLQGEPLGRAVVDLAPFGDGRAPLPHAVKLATSKSLYATLGDCELQLTIQLSPAFRQAMSAIERQKSLAISAPFGSGRMDTQAALEMLRSMNSEKTEVSAPFAAAKMDSAHALAMLQSINAARSQEEVSAPFAASKMDTKDALLLLKQLKEEGPEPPLVLPSASVHSRGQSFDRSNVSTAGSQDDIQDILAKLMSDDDEAGAREDQGEDDNKMFTDDEEGPPTFSSTDFGELEWKSPNSPESEYGGRSSFEESPPRDFLLKDNDSVASHSSAGEKYSGRAGKLVHNGPGANGQTVPQESSDMPNGVDHHSDDELPNNGDSTHHKLVASAGAMPPPLEASIQPGKSHVKPPKCVHGISKELDYPQDYQPPPVAAQPRGTRSAGSSPLHAKASLGDAQPEATEEHDFDLDDLTEERLTFKEIDICYGDEDELLTAAGIAEADSEAAQDGSNEAAGGEAEEGDLQHGQDGHGEEQQAHVEVEGFMAKDRGLADDAAEGGKLAASTQSKDSTTGSLHDAAPMGPAGPEEKAAEGEEVVHEAASKLESRREQNMENGASRGSKKERRRTLIEQTMERDRESEPRDLRGQSRPEKGGERTKVIERQVEEAKKAAAALALAATATKEDPYYSEPDIVGAGSEGAGTGPRFSAAALTKLQKQKAQAEEKGMRMRILLMEQEASKGKKRMEEMEADAAELETKLQVPSHHGSPDATKRDGLDNKKQSKRLYDQLGTLQGDADGIQHPWLVTQAANAAVAAAKCRAAAAEALEEQHERSLVRMPWELRDRSVMEVAVYGFSDAHGSSCHKMHTPARRLARAYFHARQKESLERVEHTARAAVSALVLAARSSGEDVGRLVFWWSNCVMLREIIAMATEQEAHLAQRAAALARAAEAAAAAANQAAPLVSKIMLRSSSTLGAATTTGGPVAALRKSASERQGGTSRDESTADSVSEEQAEGGEEGKVKQVDDGTRGATAARWAYDGADWEHPQALLAALARVERWLHSRVLQIIWWHIMTPAMQKKDKQTAMAATAPPVRLESIPLDSELCRADSLKPSVTGESPGRQAEGAISRWRWALLEVFRKLCPARGIGEDCGCLPTLTWQVLEQCGARLDTALFNALLRDGGGAGMPTDPVSDPLTEPAALPIQPGQLTFGGGVQLKIAISAWSAVLTEIRCTLAPVLTERRMVPDRKVAHLAAAAEAGHEDADCDAGVDVERFQQLRALADLLMLPKEMLMDHAVRKEACSNLSLAVIRRIITLFQTDELAPDAISPSLVAALNAEIAIKGRKNQELPIETWSSTLPAVITPYVPPSPAVVRALIAGNGKPLGIRSAKVPILERGYASDDDINEAESPLELLVDGLTMTPRSAVSTMEQLKESTKEGYRLLRAALVT
eukprot:SM000168S02583  [mRNA]  locus=s168:35959:43415:- [translate_table: standard]